MLKSQAIYGRKTGQWSQGPLSIGRCLFPLVAEDASDDGPQVGAGGTMVLVADIRLDNRDELAAALAILTPNLAVMSDAAVLFHAINRWGEGAVDRLVGDFAFAAWDARQKRLMLARDFRGQRPLHFHRGRGFFAFASMPKGLHAIPEIPIAPNNDEVAAFIALLPETGAETYFDGIEKVQPGHVVSVTPDGISARRYWTPPTTALLLRDPREYEDALRWELERAVASRLRGADGRIGAHLSSGLDSSAVAATAARQLEGLGSVTAYTAVPRAGYPDQRHDRTADEGPLAAAVAAIYPNMEHVKIPASGSSPVEALDCYFNAFERPFLNLTNGVWLKAILDDAQGRALKVMLSGQAGNMTISYDGMAALAQMLREKRWIALARLAGSLVRGGTPVTRVGARALGPFLPGIAWRAILRARGKAAGLLEYTLINPNRLPALEKLAAERGLDPSYQPSLQEHAGHVLAMAGGVDPGNYNKGYLGGWGVDVRDPTADQRLFELCLTIPAEQFLLGGTPRSLARRAFADRLPAAVCAERKKGYQAADWHEALHNARLKVEDEVERCSELPAARRVLSTNRMRQLITDWPEGQWHRKGVVDNYRLALLRAISAGHFLRRASGSNL